MKKLFITVTLAIAAINVFAQKAEEVYAKWNKKSVPGVAIVVDGDAKTAIKTLKDELKDEDIKVKGGSTITAEAATFKRVSPNMMNIYATAEQLKENKTKVTVFLATGQETSTFVSSSSDATAISNLQSFLETDFAKTQNAEALKLSIKTHEKAVKAGEKQEKALNKKIEDLNKKLNETKEQLANQKNENKKVSAKLSELKSK